MKTRILSVIMSAAMFFTSAAALTAYPEKVIAAEITASLINTQVSFDGGEPVTIQSYAVSGEAYVRAAEIARHIGIGVEASYHETGVLLKPTMPYSGSELEKLAETAVSVELTTGIIFYDGMRYENASCFKYGGRYYYKLADLLAASRYSLEQNIIFTERDANGNFYDEALKKTFTTYEMEFDAASGIATVTAKVTDLQKMFDDIRAGRNPETPEDASNAPAALVAAAAARSALENTPEIGSVPADILIDKNGSAYNADGSVNMDNLTEPYRNYQKSYVGQCTWYAFGRFYEVNSFDPSSIKAGTIGLWAEKVMSGDYPGIAFESDANAITAGSIAVWDNHVVFVEYVERGSDGEPVSVYFTEANTRNDGIYYPDKDAKVKQMTFEEFINRDSRSPLRGYVAAK